MPLSPTELAHYDSQGWLIPRTALSASDVAYYRHALDELIAANPHTRPERLVSAHIEAGAASSGTEGTTGDRRFMELAQHPAILDCVQQTIGPDFLLWGCQVFAKPGRTGMEVPMHQDGNYWPIRPLTTCTVWIALDDSDRENGCLKGVCVCVCVMEVCRNMVPLYTS
jgi:ectoine hydroxylase-related dioxygenase (phytanoyl-CoA dioxygenase family)